MTNSQPLPQPAMFPALPTEDTARSRADRLATGISNAANPGLLALPMLLLVAVATAPSLGRALLWWSVATLGITGVPLLYITRGVRTGRFSDAHLTRREQRVWPLMVSLVSASATLLALVALHAATALVATVTAIVAGGALALGVTHGLRWKISLHLGGLTGWVMVCLLLFGWPALLLAVAVPGVAWARLQLHAHTLAQVLAGVAVAIGTTLLVFWSFGLLGR